jgi:hypothetical protein
MKIYIAGPISKYPHESKSYFRDEVSRVAQHEEYFRIILRNRKEKELRTINPREHDIPDDTPASEVWSTMMKMGIAELLDCDAIVLTSNWQESHGASVEMYLAHLLSIPVFIWDSKTSNYMPHTFGLLNMLSLGLYAVKYM